jgi:hypothetical protein
VRFKDLLGRSNKPDPEPSSGRLVTTPGGLAPPSPPPQTSAEPPAVPPEPPKPAVEAAKSPTPVAGRAADLPVADAFAHLLAVEQGELVAAPEPEPEVAAAAPAAIATLSDADVERIALRVAERLGRTTFAADVQRIVADVSERLIREEIQRIRQAAESRLG